MARTGLGWISILLTGTTRTRRTPIALVAAAAVMAVAAPTASGAGTITVVGEGSARAVNDVAKIGLRVETRASTATAALTKNSQIARRVIAAIKARGIPSADIKTEHVSLSHFRERHGQQRVVVYRAVNAVRVTVRRIGKTGALIDAAVKAGATGVSTIELTTSKLHALYRTALGNAYDDARAKALILAQHAGVALGAPVAIEEGIQEPPPVFASPQAGGAGSGSAPIEPGRSTVHADVTVTFATG